MKVKGENLFNFHFLIFKIIKQKLIDKNVICKKYNVKIFNKHKLNAVGADASVRLEKNQNKNYIRTFEKLKLNVVGVGVPDDPQKNHKIKFCGFLFSIFQIYFVFLFFQNLYF